MAADTTIRVHAITEILRIFNAHNPAPLLPSLKLQQHEYTDLYT